MVGTTWSIVNGTAVEGSPLGGMATVIWALAGVAISLAGTCAVNCKGLMNVVTRGDPFHRTSPAPPTSKPVPLTVMVRSGPPAVAELGLSVLIVGARHTTSQVCHTGQGM